MTYSKRKHLGNWKGRLTFRETGKEVERILKQKCDCAQYRDPENKSTQEMDIW